MALKAYSAIFAVLSGGFYGFHYQKDYIASAGMGLVILILSVLMKLGYTL